MSAVCILHNVLFFSLCILQKKKKETEDVKMCFLKLVCCYELACDFGLHDAVSHENRALGGITHSLIFF